MTTPRLTLVVALVATIGLTREVSAQAGGTDRALYQRLMDGTAGLVYWAAWPTARYEKLVLKDIDFVSGGAVVTLRLHGISAFTDGDLWVDVKVGLRSTGEVTSLQWGDYNGFFPPGFTWSALGEAVAEINRRSGTPTSVATSRPRPPVPPALTVVCIRNATTQVINYSMKWGAKTEQLNLQAGEVWRFWAPADAGAFDIGFDGDLTPAHEQRSFRLTGVTHATPPTMCSDDLTIEFVASGTRLGVQPKVWSPGSAHPFMPNVVSGRAKNSWQCASGFRWYARNDTTSLDCVESRYGYVGVSVVVDDGSRFPRVSRTTPGSPAELAGIRSGVYIVSIDGISTEGLTAEAVVARIRGDVGTTVRLGVTAGTDPPRIVFVRRQ